MPSKDHRVAARHAKLRQRPKRNAKRPPHIPSITTASVPEESRASAPTGISPPLQKSLRREQTAPAPAVYTYVKTEIKRILLLSGGIVTILIVVGFAFT